MPQIQRENILKDQYFISFDIRALANLWGRYAFYSFWHFTFFFNVKPEPRWTDELISGLSYCIIIAKKYINTCRLESKDCAFYRFLQKLKQIKGSSRRIYIIRTLYPEVGFIF